MTFIQGLLTASVGFGICHILYVIFFSRDSRLVRTMEGISDSVISVVCLGLLIWSKGSS
jgi:cytosine/uracil/thiamine/allantoin permease